MGIILAKFRKKITTYEQLEKLDHQIKSIEEYGKSTEVAQKKVAGRFVLVSVFVYVITALIFYFYFFPATVYERLLYVIPLITAPLIIISVKRILTWWYNRKITRNYEKLSVLKGEKKKMLDKVMETETYKVAKKILEEFAPDEVITRRSADKEIVAMKLETPSILSRADPIGLRHRGDRKVEYGRTSLGSVTNMSLRGGRSLDNLPLASTPSTNFRSLGHSIMPTPRLPMARAILPKERTAFDKLVDYLVGDGPSNRYALICKECSGHNGMALREEFEYLNFQCCYCHAFNPAKKQRPPAPRLGASPPKAIKAADTSDSEKNSDSESDTEDQKDVISPAIMNSVDKPQEENDNQESQTTETSSPNVNGDDDI